MDELVNKRQRNEQRRNEWTQRTNWEQKFGLE